MMPTEELHFRTVLRAAQDQADAMLACGGAPKPTALLMRMAEGAQIEEAALVDLSDFDEATLRDFVRTNAERPDVHAIALSKMVSPPLRVEPSDPPGAERPTTALVIHLVAHQREASVINDIDPVSGRLRRGQFDPRRQSRVFLDPPTDG